MITRDIKDGDKVLRRIFNELQKPEALEHDFAEAVLRQAVQTASSRPTPQAPMAARGLSLQGSTIRSLAGGASGAVAASAEFGSDIYLQFHAAHNPRGYWLYPSAESASAHKAGDDALEDILQRAIRGTF